MNEQTITTGAELSFTDFLFRDKYNSTILKLAAVLIVVQFIIFKYLYPYANFIHGDSFVYIKAAASNSDISTHMIGYSRFLRLISVFSSSDTALVTIQYILAQAAGLFFLYTIFFFHNIHKITQIILVCFLILNPLFLYMANLVSTDCLFMTLSLFWFALLLWLINRPSVSVIFWHTIVIFFAFIVRYNALIYPIIGLLTFFMTKLTLKTKIVGIAGPLLLCGLFILYTGNKYKALTGIWQYSPFSGWQMANNAMYIYRYVDSADRKAVPEKFRELDNMIRTYFDTTRNIYRFPLEGIKASTFYMWTRTMPLYQYREKMLGKDTSLPELQKWAQIAPLFKEYGIYIIKQYPLKYAEHFLWPNALKYYAPPIEYLEFYNNKQSTVNSVAQSWFGYKTSKVHSRIKDSKSYPLDIFPILTGSMNIMLLCCLICFFILLGFRTKIALSKTIILVMSIWLLNAAFTIFSTPAAIRFQSFPIILITTFCLVLIDWMYKLTMTAKIVNDFKISAETIHQYKAIE
jgi:hypothetical protein